MKTLARDQTQGKNLKFLKLIFDCCLFVNRLAPSLRVFRSGLGHAGFHGKDASSTWIDPDRSLCFFFFFVRRFCALDRYQKTTHGHPESLKMFCGRSRLLMISVRPSISTHTRPIDYSDIYLHILFVSRAGAVWRWRWCCCHCLASLGCSDLWQSTRIPSFFTTSSPSPTHYRYFLSDILILAPRIWECKPPVSFFAKFWKDSK